MVTVDPQSVPFSVPFVTGGEIERLGRVIASDHTQGDGPFTKLASRKIERITGAGSALLTGSCSHALDMSMQLIGVGPGDEVILPSFTFPSAANAIVLAGATPVFVDCEPETGNVDTDAVLAAVTERTRAVIVMHYGGVPVNLEPLLALNERGIAIVEDNAHGLGVQSHLGQLGTIGSFGTLSFHATKNLQAGEAGSLLVNDERFALQAEIVREKGTNRSQFLRGQVDKYTWVERGSSYLPSEYTAAILDAQLDAFDEIQMKRIAVWNRYAAELAEWAEATGVTLMRPAGGVHAAHMFFVLTPTATDQQNLLAHARSVGVQATFHYQPLHRSPAGERYGRTHGELASTVDFASRLVRLPLWTGMSSAQIDRVISAVTTWRPELSA